MTLCLHDAHTLAPDQLTPGIATALRDAAAFDDDIADFIEGKGGIERARVSEDDGLGYF